MSRLHFEAQSDEPCPVEFGGPSDVLVYFLSLAFATRYGAQHEFSKLALLLRGGRKIDLAPLLTFADRNVEEEADARELERVWQDPLALANAIRAVIGALESGDDEIDALISGAPDLVPRLRDLLAMAEWAQERGARARLTFDL